jgi:hypothetical protein
MVAGNPSSPRVAGSVRVWSSVALAIVPALAAVCFDVARSSLAGDLRAWVALLAMTTVLVAPVGVSLAALRGGRALLLVPAGLWVLLGAPLLLASMMRVSELWRGTRDGADLLIAVMLAAATARWAKERASRWPLRPAVRFLVLAAPGVAIAALLPRVVPALWHPLRGVAVAVVGAAVLFWLAHPRRSPPWLLSVAAASLAALHRLDPVYAELRGWLAGVFVLFAYVGLRRALEVWLPSRFRWGQAAWAVACVAVLGFAAERGVRRDPSVLGAADGHGLARVFVGAIQRASDADGDGYGVLFGQADCAPFDPRVHPGAHEAAGNGVDDNCLLDDAERASADSVRGALRVNPRPAAQVGGQGGDIVVILIDTLRYDTARLPGMGTLRRLEAQGVRFDRAYATASFTIESVLGVLTGALGPEVDYEWSTSHDASPLTVPPTLFEQLGARGFDTGAAGMVGRGFAADRLTRGARVRESAMMDADATETTRLARSVWSRLDPSKRRFLYAHYMDVHAYEWDSGVDKRAAYDARALRTDRALGELLQDIGEGATVIVLADHGESFGLHGARGHSTTIYEEVIHVPLYVRGPGIAPRVDAHVTSLLAIAPTALALAGDPRAPATGAYLCLGGGGCGDMDAPVALEHGAVHLHGLVRGDRHVLRDLALLRTTAFDLAADPDELHPLVPDRVLGDALSRWEESGWRAGSVPPAFSGWGPFPAAAVEP